ncbi:Uncharacterised protein [[Clostridium] sordellii]|uniref:hypothetical protein n=1 Tax=Paraclostridium sordellii TaxID=1505 RepID=UPI0005DB44BC|nr:hypothetical protein [Paeniclostridium sordellii]CEP93019.1 Uncharacterised protein [[Clostridium] sordellii] [Paeniclostridium sordellii]CEQ30258.1 Uncharacterised protein [[Clostridium] sordellii] [Paeniclostridium sordellii]
MYPYYILNTNNFHSLIDGYTLPVQCTLDQVIQKDPSVSFFKKDIQNITNHIKYDLICESKKVQKGRAYNSDEIFDYFISIDEKNAYFNTINNTFIIVSSRNIFNYFYRSFAKTSSNINNIFNKIDVNFVKIIDNQNHLGLQGVWLGDYGDNNIDALYLIGNKIEDSSQYQQLIAKGATISNVTIAYNYMNTLYKIMLTRDGGVILYSKLEPSDALPLIQDIYNKILSI